MCKKLLLLSFLLIGIVFANMQDISTCEVVANNFAKSYGYENLIIRDSNPIQNPNSDRILGYVFRTLPTGYIAVSNNSLIRPVIAWSFENDYRPGHKDNVIEYMLIYDLYNRHESIENNARTGFVENERLWNMYLGSSKDILDATELDMYGPWLVEDFNQSAPYNRYCPIDPITEEQCPSGCVITAVSTIFNYWQFPYRIPLTSADSYESDITDPPIYIDAETANMDTIAWSSLAGGGVDDDVIGQVMWATGVKLNAVYSDEGTSAHCEAANFTRDFGFIMAEDRTTSRPGYREAIEEDMVNGKVAYMSLNGGTVHDAGHAVVIDGYEVSGAFHVNTGWGGHENGWYHVFEETPLDYGYITSMITNITANYHWDYESRCSRAERIDVPLEEATKINAIFPEDDEEWFVFHASDDSTYIFRTTGPNSMYMEIFESCDGEAIFHCDTGGTEYNFRAYWTPDIDASGDYYIKLGATESTPECNYTFRFKRQTGPDRPSITIMYPAGGETFLGGDEVTLFWSIGGFPTIEYVKLEYSIDGDDGPWETIADSISGIMHRWTVPTFEEPLYNYGWSYIRVSDPVNGYAISMNPSPFRIRDPEKVDENVNTPDFLSLSAYPNPFNSAVYIDTKGFDNPSIEVFDIFGKSIRVMHKGNTLWNGKDSFGSEVEAGVYLVKVTDRFNSKITRVIYSK